MLAVIKESNCKESMTGCLLSYMIYSMLWIGFNTFDFQGNEFEGLHSYLSTNDVMCISLTYGHAYIAQVRVLLKKSTNNLSFLISRTYESAVSCERHARGRVVSLESSLVDP